MDPLTGKVWTDEQDAQGFMRVFNNAYHTDVMLTVGTHLEKRLYNAHEAIISRASEYLKKVCLAAKKFDDRKYVNIVNLNIDPEAMGVVLRWIYGDPYPFSETNSSWSCGNIIIAASKLGIEKLGIAAVDSFEVWRSDPEQLLEYVFEVNNENFKKPPEYWGFIRNICNWTHGRCLEDLVTLTRDITPSLPAAPEWIIKLSNGTNSTLLAALLLERQQMVCNFWSCKKCKVLQMERTTAIEPSECEEEQFSCSDCGVREQMTVKHMDFIKREIITAKVQEIESTSDENEDESMSSEISNELENTKYSKSGDCDGIGDVRR
ncbi:hypothetical protein TWF106_007408 [Orbilia oligospora]|uniref:BTB domain-containing protein n=1 Tax=Orbilia oligospora TaxID=2813651 RepID=A0A7C8V5C8_ORBOL|nr:hypothetical protein TWF106_007408 [Orbilia oligospora]